MPSYDACRAQAWPNLAALGANVQAEHLSVPAVCYDSREALHERHETPFPRSRQRLISELKCARARRGDASRCSALQACLEQSRVCAGASARGSATTRRNCVTGLCWDAREAFCLLSGADSLSAHCSSVLLKYAGHLTPRSPVAAFDGPGSGQRNVADMVPRHEQLTVCGWWRTRPDERRAMNGAWRTKRDAGEALRER